jgi:hypothetical protein
MRLYRFGVLLALFAAPTNVALAQSTGLDDLVGARAGQAELEVQRRGYRNTGGSQGDDRTYTNWWNADRRQCVVIATMDGRYSSITPTTAPDCRQSSPAQARPDYGRPDHSGPIVEGRPVELGLVCFGDGTRTGLSSGTAWTWNREHERYDYGRINETRPEVFDASLTIQTWEGGGRIRLPRSMIPPINSRGNNGWWELSDVSVEPDTIRATYRLNGLNKPRVNIDRRSGRVTIAGTADYGFRGTCDLIGHEPRRF